MSSKPVARLIDEVVMKGGATEYTIMMVGMQQCEAEYLTHCPQGFLWALASELRDLSRTDGWALVVFDTEADARSRASAPTALAAGAVPSRLRVVPVHELAAEVSGVRKIRTGIRPFIPEAVMKGGRDPVVLARRIEDSDEELYYCLNEWPGLNDWLSQSDLLGIFSESRAIMFSDATALGRGTGFTPLRLRNIGAYAVKVSELPPWLRSRVVQQVSEALVKNGVSDYGYALKANWGGSDCYLMAEDGRYVWVAPGKTHPAYLPGRPGIHPENRLERRVACWSSAGAAEQYYLSTSGYTALPDNIVVVPGATILKTGLQLEMQ